MRGSVYLQGNIFLCRSLSDLHNSSCIRIFKVAKNDENNPIRVSAKPPDFPERIFLNGDRAVCFIYRVWQIRGYLLTLQPDLK